MNDKQIESIAGPVLENIQHDIRNLGIDDYLTDKQFDAMIERIEVRLYALAKAAIQAERAGRQAAEQEPVWPDDYILTVKVYLDGQPGYSHELRRDCPQDITNLLGSIEGELDCVEGVIRVLWPNHTEWQEFHAAANLILRAADVLRDLQKRQTHGRIILKFDGNDLMYLTQFITRAEWEATSDQEFAGW